MTLGKYGRRMAGAVAMSALVACGTSLTGSASDEANGAAPGGGSGTAANGEPSNEHSGQAPSTSNVAGGGSTLDAAMIANASCAAATPPGAATAQPLPTYAGTCPALAVPPEVTTITSSAASREFYVFRPSTIEPGEKLPVVFLWHWLGGTAVAMGSRLEVQAAVDLHRFIGVVPKPKGDQLFRWPWDNSESSARVEEEAKFFDDMLACIGAALPVNKECVSSAGVSAGALWTAQLAIVRSERLSSIVSLSGGTGNVAKDWVTPPHRMPAFVLFGGAHDEYPSQFPIMNFEKQSKVMEEALTADNHFIVECVHNCGHTVPPFDPPPPGGLLFDAMWQFVLAHPYWLPPGQSPYASKPLPSSFPSWCGKGAGGATPRPDTAACSE